MVCLNLRSKKNFFFFLLYWVCFTLWHDTIKVMLHNSLVFKVNLKTIVVVVCMVALVCSFSFYGLVKSPHDE